MHVAIIGNGISGITAAREIRKKSDCQITVISAETKYFYSRTALMYIYMGHMKFDNTKPYEDWFWKKNNIDLVFDWVDKIDTDNKKLLLKKSDDIQFDKLIISCGSKSNKFGWPGQDLKGAQGLFSFQDLESMEESTTNIKHAVIVGGGLIGVEMAEMLHSRSISVTFLVREAEFWRVVLPHEESCMISEHLKAHHVNLLLKTELKEILGDENGRVKGIITSTGDTIDCQFVGLTAGVSPKIDFLKDSTIETDRGILVNEYLETNILDIFAAGDCAQFRNSIGERRPIEQVWYTGKMQGKTVAQTITGTKTAYNPGVWFNSAKFFDIEYQTYGWVWTELKDNEECLFWQDPVQNRCIRIVYNLVSDEILGINVFGIRLRHEVCKKWIQDKWNIKKVLENLKLANFEREFSKHYEQELINLYNEKNPDSKIQLKGSGKLKEILSFLRTG